MTSLSNKHLLLRIQEAVQILFFICLNSSIANWFNQMMSSTIHFLVTLIIDLVGNGNAVIFLFVSPKEDGDTQRAILCVMGVHVAIRSLIQFKEGYNNVKGHHVNLHGVGVV